MWRAASSPQHCPIERSRNPAYAAGMSAPAAIPDPTPRAAAALPFWISLLFLPLLAAGAWWGGWALILLPLFGWFGVTALDALAGRERAGSTPTRPRRALGWYRAVTVLWVPLQFVAIFGRSGGSPRPGIFGMGEDRPVLRRRRLFGHHRHQLCP
jgi:hypothetical protein